MNTKTIIKLWKGNEMRPSSFKKSVLATNIAILLGSAVSISAVAAEAAATAAAPENIEKIEVRGMRNAVHLRVNGIFLWSNRKLVFAHFK
ncbi:hypothetical protein K5S30_18145, partial [Shewanella xiamenensis]|nr:hypothetical protein [Shewanella xiamenensis]MCT8878113.1 hypothetical protein [Shewanella xiamenensis]